MVSPVLKTATTMMMVTIMMMKNDAEVVEVSALTGESVLLNSGLQTNRRYEARWTHKNLLVQSGLQSECDGGHCELLADGSLRLHHVTGHCSGYYKLELFSSGGKLMDTKEFLLWVTGEDAAGRTSAKMETEEEEAGCCSGSRQSSAGRNAAICCSLLLLLLLVFTTVLILRRRRGMKRCPSSDAPGEMENVYVTMHQSKISQEEGQEASCRPDVFTETVIYV